MNGSQLGARDSDVEALPNEPLQCLRIELPDDDLLEPVVAEGVREADWLVRIRGAAKSHEEPDRCVTDPPCCEGEEPRRRAVEPLDVVHSDENRRVDGECAQRREHGARQCEPVGATRRPLDPERGRERMALRLGELVADVAKGWIEEIREPSERYRHLGLRAAGHDEPRAGALGGSTGVSPEHSLADPRLAPEQDRAGARRQTPDELVQPGDLLVPAYELDGLGGHEVEL